MLQFTLPLTYHDNLCHAFDIFFSRTNFVMATGDIAEAFSKDLLVDPTTCNVHNITHYVVAAASASGILQAGEFLKAVGGATSGHSKQIL